MVAINPLLDSPGNAPPVFPFSRYRWFQKCFDTDLTLTASLGTPSRAAIEPTGLVYAGRNVTAEFMFYGTGADNATIAAIKIYAVSLLGGPPALDYSNPITYEPILMYSFAASALLSASVGVAGGYLGTSYRFVDTLPTLVKSAYATYIETLTGRTAVLYNPADDVNIARLGIPDFGMNHGFVVDMDPGTATAMNCLIGLWT